jgi:O-antigen/teichoic acid export membrane protein
MIFLFVDMYMDVFKYLVGRGGSRYHEGLGLVPILLMANLFLGIYYNLSIWYKLSDKTRIGAWIAVAGAAVTIGLNVLFVPRYGYFASAWTKLICYGVMVYLSYIIGHRYYPVDYQLKRIAAYFAVALGLHILFTGIHSRLSGHFFASLGTGTVFLMVFFIFILRFEKISPYRLLSQLTRR